MSTNPRPWLYLRRYVAKAARTSLSGIFCCLAVTFPENRPESVTCRYIGAKTRQYWEYRAA